MARPLALRHNPARPGNARSRRLASTLCKVRQPVEDGVSIVMLARPHQRDPGPEAQVRSAFGVHDGPCNRVGQRLGQPLPAFAAAFFAGEQHEVAAVKPRGEPDAAFQLVRSEMTDALGDFDKGHVARAFAEGHVHGVDPADRDQHRVDGAGPARFRPFRLPARDRAAQLRRVGKARQDVLRFVHNRFICATHRTCLSTRAANIARISAFVAKWDARP